MEINPPRSSVINSKKLGSKLTGNKLYAKLISLNITVANRVLKDRNKYWFVVEGADLQVKIFSFTKDTVVDVTDDYLEEDDIHYFEGHTIFSAYFLTKALSLVIAWYAVTPERVAPFYTHSYFVNTEPVIVSVELVQAIYNYLLPPQPVQYDHGVEAHRDDMELDQTAHNVEGFTVFGNEYSETTNQQHEPPYYDRQHYNNNTLSDPTSLEHTNENHPFGVFNAFNNNTPPVVDYEEAFDPYIHTNTADNTNVAQAQHDTENNTNVQHIVHNTLNRPPVVVGKPVVKKSVVSQRYQRIVTIKATELRRWTWEAEVLDEHPAIKCDELYMRGGQAVNSVILQCKQKMYARYPDDDIYFELKVRPRSKIPLQLQGQKFLNAVMFAWWSKQPESVTGDEPSNTNIATDHPITQHRPRPVNVTDDNTVVIMVFELEYPESHEHHACWIIQACDDDKQLAIELRTETYDLDERARLITEMKQRVRARLARDVYYHDITFTEDIQLKRPDRLRAWAYWWLGAATTRATTFANWAGRVINYFSGNNNNNQNQL